MPADGSIHGSTPTPPPLPERTDSLNNRNEEAELRKAPWFQAGIPRLIFDITICILERERVIYMYYVYIHALFHLSKCYISAE